MREDLAVRSRSSPCFGLDRQMSALRHRTPVLWHFLPKTVRITGPSSLFRRYRYINHVDSAHHGYGTPLKDGGIHRADRLL